MRIVSDHVSRKVKKLKRIRTILVPFPTYRLASSALRALSVDAEISPVVHRSLSLTVPTTSRVAEPTAPILFSREALLYETENRTVLKTVYHATTHRMLRVAANGFMESLGVVLGVMEELDVDVLGGKC